jgi:hypothetical protein
MVGLCPTGDNYFIPDSLSFKKVSSASDELLSTTVILFLSAETNQPVLVL